MEKELSVSSRDQGLFLKSVIFLLLQEKSDILVSLHFSQATSISQRFCLYEYVKTDTAERGSCTHSLPRIKKQVSA